MTNLPRCAERVWAEYHDYRCTRSAGHGTSGRWCAQHVPMHEMPPPSETWYAVQHSLSEPVIVPVGVISSTDKTVLNATGRRVNIRDQYRTLHRSYDAALSHARSMLLEKIDSYRTRADQHEATLNRLMQATQPEDPT